MFVISCLKFVFNTIASKKLKQLLSSDWSGANWSDRLWRDRAVVGKKVTEILQKGVTQGTSLQKMARELKQATNQSFNNAFRLIRTETSHIDGQVTLEGYKQASDELGLEYYEYDAFLDSRTSTICRELNGKRFKVSEAEVGVNYPPMHPNCRSTTQLVLDEKYKQEEKPKEETKTIDELILQQQQKYNEDYDAERKKEKPNWEEFYKNQAKSIEEIKKEEIKRGIINNEISTEELNRLNNIAQNLSNQEKQALYGYTDRNYKEINAFLRGENKRDSFKNDIEIIEEALRKGATTEKITVYRVVNLDFGRANLKLSDQVEDYIRSLQDGATLGDKAFETIKGELLGQNWTEKGFLSTAINKSGIKEFEKETNNKPILMRINLPKGTNALPLANLSKYANENELLINKNYKMKIVDCSPHQGEYSYMTDKIQLTVDLY
ncbi:minor capsid protein [bacterium]|nr:minor capsid protein [bacterium]MBQ9149729.1 minor capsid protein [bacterium]